MRDWKDKKYIIKLPNLLSMKRFIKNKIEDANYVSLCN